MIAIGIVVLFLGFLVFILNFSSEKKPDESLNQQSSSSISSSSATVPEDMKQPKMQIDKTKSYTAVIETSEGIITLTLNAKETPITVNNFVALSKKKFYNNTIFHRVIKGFMIQGGDPEGTGRGGPGYKFDDEKFDAAYTRGTIAMANAGPNTNGSQFFIIHKDYDLPKNYTIFGKVTEGLDVVDKIAEGQTQSGGEGSTPVKPVKVLSIKIEEK